MIQLIGLIVGLYTFTRLLAIASAPGRYNDAIRVLAVFAAIITAGLCITLFFYRAPTP